MMTLIQTILVVVILVLMVMLLLGINHLFMGSFDTEEEDVIELREEVKNNSEVISEKNIFHSLLTSKVAVRGAFSKRKK